MKNFAIDDYLKILINQPLTAIGRASNMLWLGFGKEIECINFRGNAVKKSSIALHVQSPWRVINKIQGKMLFAQSDFYSSNGSIKEMNDFDWNIQGTSLFDKKSEEWFSEVSQICVSDFKLNKWGDLLLLFSNGDALEVLVTSSDETECWRLLELDSEKNHLVVTGKGVSFE